MNLGDILSWLAYRDPLEREIAKQPAPPQPPAFSSDIERWKQDGTWDRIAANPVAEAGARALATNEKTGEVRVGPMTDQKDLSRKGLNGLWRSNLFGGSVFLNPSIPVGSGRYNDTLVHEFGHAGSDLFRRATNATNQYPEVGEEFRQRVMDLDYRKDPEALQESQRQADEYARTGMKSWTMGDQEDNSAGVTEVVRAGEHRMGRAEALNDVLKRLATEYLTRTGAR